MNYEKYFRMVVETNHKGVVLLLSQQFLNELNQMLNSKIKHDTSKMTPKPNKKPPENICGLLLKIKVVKVISMAQVLRDPIIDKPSQHHLLNFRYHW